MRTFLGGVRVSLFGLMMATVAVAQTAPAPPAPSPTVPPAVAVPAPATAPAPAPAAPAEAEKPKSPLEISAQDKRDCVIPGHHGDALTEGGKIDVKAEANVLTATLTGVTAAHCFLGCHSVGIQTFQLEQPFDVTSTDPKITQVLLKFESALNGYVRSRHKGSACMRLASASVLPAGGGSPMFGVTFPPACVCGPCGQQKYEQKYEAPAGAPLPLGRYVLVANFVLEAQADGLINARGVADFSADDLPDLWKQENDPFKDAERKDYGFVVTVTAEVVTGTPTAAPAPPTALRIKTLSPNVKRVSHEAPATVTTPAPITTRTVQPAGRLGRLGWIAPR